MVVVGEDGRVGIRSSEFGQSDPNIWHRPSASETAVRGPRWDHPGGWEQQPDHISNCVPADATAEEMNGPRAGEVYSSMIVDRPPVTDLLVRTTTSFDYRMAPLIVLTGPWARTRPAIPSIANTSRLSSTTRA